MTTYECSRGNVLRSPDEKGFYAQVWGYATNSKKNIVDWLEQETTVFTNRQAAWEEGQAIAEKLTEEA